MGNKVNFNTKQANPEAPGVEDIDPKELFEKRASVKIVDVRRPDEYTGELGHVGGSELIVLDTLPQVIDELPKDQTIVFVCKSGGRSARATAFAHQNGFSDVYNMKGGMMLWNQLGLDVEGKNS